MTGVRPFQPLPEEDGVPRRYPAEFGRKVLDLVAAGRPVAQVAHDLDIAGDLYLAAAASATLEQ